MANGQNDTIVYFSKNGETVTDIKDASNNEVLTKKSKTSYVLKSYYKSKKKWVELNKTTISSLTDSTFLVESPRGKVIRTVKPMSGHYFIRDYKDNKLINEGNCKLFFPLVKNGNWKEYSLVTRRLIIDGNYVNNKLISNKYWIEGLGYINDVFSQVDSVPTYGDNYKELLQFITESLQYPNYARDNNIKGKVIIRFVVMTDGSIKGVEIVEAPDPYLAAEALRVVNSIPSKWKPGTIGGRKVNTRMSIPINFDLIGPVPSH